MQTCASRTEDYEDYNKSIDTPSEKALVKLHRNVIHAMQTNKRHQTQWSMMMGQAFNLEDRIMNEMSVDKRYKHSFPVQRHWIVQRIYSSNAGTFRELYMCMQVTFSVIFLLIPML